MADYRDEFQKLLESTYIPTVGDRAKAGGNFGNDSAVEPVFIYLAGHDV